MVLRSVTCSPFVCLRAVAKGKLDGPRRKAVCLARQGYSLSAAAPMPAVSACQRAQFSDNNQHA